MTATLPVVRAADANAALSAPVHERIDQLELAMLQTGTPIELPLSHDFTRGIYIRQIFMPAGSIVTSKIHKTQHPYVILKGRCSVFIPGQAGIAHLSAPHIGVTEPGTRRVLFMHEDTVWVTFHPNPEDEQDLEVIEERLIERRELPDGQRAFDHYQQLLSEFAAQLPQPADAGAATGAAVSEVPA